MPTSERLANAYARIPATLDTPLNELNKDRVA
jgi:hypothetical protein